mgnify:CR=1 FL=1
MPSEYEALVAALKLTDIPFAEYGWNKRPEGTYGVVSLDFEADSLNGDDGKQMTSWQGSVDLFVRMKKDLERLKDLVENALEEVCEASWQVNSIQHESQTGYFHYEWVFEVE